MVTDELPQHELPGLSGNNAPIHDELVIDELPIEGKLPSDFNGMFVRNGPNPYFQPDWRYHPFDGDGMVHSVRFCNGRASYRNRWVRTAALAEEQAAGRALWTGIREKQRLDRPDEPMKNTSNTDVKYHAGRLVSMWYRSGIPYALDPDTLETVGRADYGGAIDSISAHSRPDEATGELMWFDYGTKPPFMRYGVIGPDGKSRTNIEIPLPGPRLPHDMAITANYSVLHDFPLLLDDDAWKLGRYKLKFHPEMPTRFAVVPRHGSTADIRWFDAKPCYLLHVVNAWEEGSEIVMVGTPYRTYEDAQGRIDARRLERTIHDRQRDFWLYEWRFDLRTGKTHERVIDDLLNTEFPVINSAYQGLPTRFSYHIVFPYGGQGDARFGGLAKIDHRTGAFVAWSEGPTSYYNESGFAPRDGATSEDDGYIVGFAWNAPKQRSEIHVFDARGNEFGRGPIARVVMPRRVPSGFHATYVSDTVMRRWPKPK